MSSWQGAGHGPEERRPSRLPQEPARFSLLQNRLAG